MKLLDTAHPFLRPAWRRYLIVAVCFLWAAVEAAQGNPIWGYLFAAIGGYLAWNLIVTYRPGGDGGDGDDDGL